MTSSRDVSVVEQALRIAREHPGEVLAIVGPTATGKTSLAVELSARLGGEVVSADSVQIYRAFDIGSGKPTAEQLASAPHHLLSAIGPLDPIDAASWADLAAEALDGIRARGRVPILCGGSFLWVKALLFGLADAPAASAEVRDRHRAIAASEGRHTLHARLREVDVESANRLHPNDLVRVSRALEVFELTRKPLSAWHREHAFARIRRQAKLIAIGCEPTALTERIRNRVRTWIAKGWIEEVEQLVATGYDNARAMGSVGYAQVRAMLAGELRREDLETAIVQATRVFARRQRTWLNRAEVVRLG
jgi:tRNA dimethylallyltransferase